MKKMADNIGVNSFRYENNQKIPMILFLAMASVGGGHQELTILKGILSNWGDWGTMAALIAIGAALGLSVYWTVKGDMGYVVDAFT